MCAQRSSVVVGIVVVVEVVVGVVVVVGSVVVVGATVISLFGSATMSRPRLAKSWAKSISPATDCIRVHLHRWSLNLEG